MKDIIEKYKNGELTVGEVMASDLFLVEGDEIKTDGETYVVPTTYWAKNCDKVIKMHQIDKEIEAMEKQPTEYEYVHLTESDFDVWDLKDLLDGGELFSKRSDGKYTQYTDRSPLYMLNHFGEYGVYRRIELTPEQLHERKVEDLAKSIKAANPIGQDIKFHEMSSMHLDAYASMAKAALEWMESKGK